MSTTQPVKADLILDSFQILNWDVLAKSDSSPLVTLRVSSNQLAPASNQLNAFSVGLKIVPRSGATGLLAIQSVIVPESNAVFASYSAPPVLTDVGGGLQTISADNAVLANVPVPASGLALFSARFYSPGNNALGTFDVYADRDTTNFFTTTEFDGLKFANVSAVGSVQGVLLGSIEVSAVPEPTSVLLFATSALTYLVRRRKRKDVT